MDGKGTSINIYFGASQAWFTYILFQWKHLLGIWLVWNTTHMYGSKWVTILHVKAKSQLPMSSAFFLCVCVFCIYYIWLHTRHIFNTKMAKKLLKKKITQNFICKYEASCRFIFDISLTGAPKDLHHYYMQSATSHFSVIGRCKEMLKIRTQPCLVTWQVCC